MEYKVQTPHSWQRTLEVTVPSSEVQLEIDRLSDHYSRTTKVDGFRPGKVPSQLLKAKQFSKLQEEAVEKVINSAYQEVLQELKLSPVSVAKISGVTFEPEAELSFSASFEVVPDIEIKKYKKVRCTKKLRDVGEAQVKAELEKLRDSSPVLKPVEREVREDDAVVIDLKVYEGRKLERKMPESTLFVKNMSEAVREKLVGRRTGDTVNLEDHVGLTRISIREVKEPLYPEMDDAFAKDVGFDDLTTLKGKITEQLIKAEELRSEREVHDELMSRLIDENPFDAPPSLIEAQLDEISMEPEVREKARGQALYLVKRAILLDKIADLEGISVSQEELDEEIEKIAGNENVAAERLRGRLEKTGGMSVLRNRMRDAKVLTLLVNESSMKTAKVKE